MRIGPALPRDTGSPHGKDVGYVGYQSLVRLLSFEFTIQMTRCNVSWFATVIALVALATALSANAFVSPLSEVFQIQG